MSTPQPPVLTPEQRLALEQRARYDRLMRNLAIGGAVLCPIIALMPPRKLDLYTFSLGIGFYLSADHLAQQYNGRPLVQQIRWSSPVRELPTEKAREMARVLREREEAEREKVMREAVMRGDGQPAKERRPFWRKVWMGDEEEGWKERRMAEERKALEEGKTYTSIILDQIWEVWTWEKKKGDGRDSSKDGGRKE